MSLQSLQLLQRGPKVQVAGEGYEVWCRGYFHAYRNACHLRRRGLWWRAWVHCWGACVQVRLDGNEQRVIKIADSENSVTLGDIVLPLTEHLAAVRVARAKVLLPRLNTHACAITESEKGRTS